ncbi:hypothetical protein FMM68_11135 [Lachnospiraceae bacterium MD329]|nr:hypothetical protein [Lachnospiraceae bacterium MD329]
MKKMLEKALARQQELISTAKAEQRELSEAEQRELDTLQGVIDDINARENNNDGDGARGADEGNNDGGTPEQTPPAEPTGGARGAEGYSPEIASEIMTMCRTFGLEPDTYVREYTTVEAARAAIMDELMKRNQPVGGRVETIADENDKFRNAATDGILLRQGINIANPADGANGFRALSIREIAIDTLEREAPGEDYRHMDSTQLYDKLARGFYNPTSAFPAILDSVVQKSYIEGLKKTRTQYEKWTGEGTLTDFKESKNHEYIMSLGGTLAEIPENGELPAYKPLDVAMPTRKLKTYGRQFTMTREAFINDDIGLITTMPQRYAAMSANTQNELIYSIILKNKTIFDDKPLFDATRGNTLKTGTNINLKALETMIYMLGMQKDAAGNQLQLMPDFFLVPLGMGTPLLQILSSPTIHTADNTQAYNPYTHMNFEVIEDVTINAMTKPGDALPWFMGVKYEGIQRDYLNGQKEPNIKRGEVPGKLGLAWDIYHDFGVGVKHPQTIIRNPGVVLSLGE